jgi:hypothetical protein
LAIHFTITETLTDFNRLVLEHLKICPRYLEMIPADDPNLGMMGVVCGCDQGFELKANKARGSQWMLSSQGKLEWLKAAKEQAFEYKSRIPPTEWERLLQEETAYGDAD